MSLVLLLLQCYGTFHMVNPVKLLDVIEMLLFDFSVFFLHCNFVVNAIVVFLFTSR